MDLENSDVSEERSAYFIRMTKLGELGATVVPNSPILVTLMK
jgi:hypothetical protein